MMHRLAPPSARLATIANRRTLPRSSSIPPPVAETNWACKTRLGRTRPASTSTTHSNAAPSTANRMASAEAATAVASATLPRGLRSMPALFVRGGTSNGLVVLRTHLPADRADWGPVLAAAMGSPDPAHARQLDGMGGGASSTSKVCIVAPVPDGGGEGGGGGEADVEFTFVQVGVRDGCLDMAGNCGNMSAAVGPACLELGFLDEDRLLVEEEAEVATPATAASGSTGRQQQPQLFATVRILNTNTAKIVRSRFRVDRLDETPESLADADARHGRQQQRQPRGPRRYRYRPDGDHAMAGVPGTGSRITLSFLDPAGAATGRREGGRGAATSQRVRHHNSALPTGLPAQMLRLPDGSQVEASLVDVSNPGVFVRGADMGVTDEVRAKSTAGIEADGALMARLELVRGEGARAMGLDPLVQSVPKVVLLFPSAAAAGGSEGGGQRQAREVDIECLALSMGQVHRAVPLTLALCLGASAHLPGTVAAGLLRRTKDTSSSSSPAGGTKTIVIGHPSGKVEVGTTTTADGSILSAQLHRTARILMKGDVVF